MATSSTTNLCIRLKNMLGHPLPSFYPSCFGEGQNVVDPLLAPVGPGLAGSAASQASQCVGPQKALTAAALSEEEGCGGVGMRSGTGWSGKGT